MSPHAHHDQPKLSDLAFEAFYSGAIGGVAIALFFLLMDMVRGQPLATPSLLGSVVFYGADPATVQGVDMTAVALFTPVHLAVFGLLGLLATGLIRWTERLTGGGFAPPALALFLILEGGFLLLSGLVAPGLASVLGQGEIFLANVLAATAMTLFLRYAHETTEAEPGEAPRHNEPDPAASVPRDRASFD